ncbi:hypothetical protein BBM40_21745 [Vibrio parahaemolyticus]|uniref:hypothetical protein n=1 Tax=Vibrio parahaemolyticus TaxID=670 RepID=UPI00084A33B3|nr:hypothetical protein [Vibrio parahaemolyticus]EHK1074918.1 hypothetical protein [Vibrio parahaemolyticus]ELB2005549.1 hypothetical protein [Vibrio parahaemolyticus]MBE4411099.1 hypothetical protein [Vibrio parahaemolyticus]MBE4486976.1 hypothetical protein [Vibrio parahaemolyticus]MBE4492126.1 hypothetical protein [Vibrio parahaemolyticus]
MAGSNFRIGEMETTVVYDGEEYSYISVIELGRNNQKVVQMFCDPNGYGDGEIVGTGLTQPIELSVKLRNVSQQHLELYVKLFLGEDRFQFTSYNKKNGRTLVSKQCILKNDPRNGTANESESTLDVELTIQVAPKNFKDEFKAVA